MKEETQKDYELQIIGAGLPRTGTLCTKIALEHLGHKTCYMIYERFDYHEIKFWVEIVQKKHRNWKEIFKNYTCTVDMPACFFWEELLKENPNAKVILTVKDSSEIWYESCVEALFPAMDHNHESLAWKMLKMFAPMISVASNFITEISKNYINNFSKDECIKFYESHIENVKEKCPKEQLLVYNVKEGWEPLCTFLGTKVPEKEFPKVDDKMEFQQIISNIKKRAYMLMAVFSGVLLGGGYLVKKRYFK